MPAVYPQCTLCEKELTAAEKKKNLENNNAYYPICDECEEKSIEKIRTILLREEK